MRSALPLALPPLFLALNCRAFVLGPHLSHAEQALPLRRVSGELAAGCAWRRPAAKICAVCSSGSEAEHLRLLERAEQQGTYVSPKVKLGVDPSGTRGWIAAEALAPGALVLSAASSSVRLSASYVRAESETGIGAMVRAYEDNLLLRGEPDKTLSDEAVLSLFLAAHFCRPEPLEESFFAAYIDSLPDTPLPLSLLRPADVVQEAADMRQHMLDSWRCCCAALAMAGELPEAGLLKGVDISYKAFERAWCLVESRSFRAGMLGRTGCQPQMCDDTADTHSSLYGQAFR